MQRESRQTVATLLLWERQDRVTKGKARLEIWKLEALELLVDVGVGRASVNHISSFHQDTFSHCWR